MSFFIKDDNVRGGNRGGRSNFKWDDIRLQTYKERECYLGGTIMLGFLSNGGKWIKHDRFSYHPPTSSETSLIQAERAKIKEEEERILRESLGIEKKDKVVKKEKLTDYEWNEMMKKEAKLNPNDPKLFSFYEDDEKKAGLGMKPNVSFRTNPVNEKNKDGLSKLEGVNFKNYKGIEETANPYEAALSKEEPRNRGNDTINQYVSSYINNKEPSRSRSRSTKKEKKHKKKHKKEKKNREKSRSRDRSHNRYKHKH